jgi:hypothetical protein
MMQRNKRILERSKPKDAQGQDWGLYTESAAKRWRAFLTQGLRPRRCALG